MANIQVDPNEGSPDYQVEEFHRTYGHPILGSAQFPDEKRIELRKKLIREELGELNQALSERDIVEVADALGDLVYVIYGMALEFGIPLAEVIDEIHRSNMSKLDDNGLPVVREDGKILKGPNYSPPNLQPILGL